VPDNQEGLVAKAEKLAEQGEFFTGRRSNREQRSIWERNKEKLGVGKGDRAHSPAHCKVSGRRLTISDQARERFCFGQLLHPARVLEFQLESFPKGEISLGP